MQKRNAFLQSVFLMSKEFAIGLKTEDGMKSASIVNIASIAAKVRSQ